MEILVGKTAGFCFGVRRAVEGSFEQVNSKTNEKVYCLGELVHNKQVIKKIEDHGIELIEDINEVKEHNSQMIIRAHGIKKEIHNIAKEKGIKIIDYTCPFVLKIHDIANEFKEKGYYIFVVGSKIHPETQGTVSYCGDKYYVIETEDDIKEGIEKLQKSNIKNLLIIVQTTFSEKKFEVIENKIKEILSNSINVVVKNTICAATSQRQKETDNISKIVDAMIIIGGKNSSNTKKLYEVAKRNCSNTFLIETKNDLNIDEIKNFKRVGIMAGASTPQDSIDEVINVLKV